MSLEAGKSKEAFSRNVATEMHAGKPQKQAVAIAYAQERRDNMNEKIDAVTDSLRRAADGVDALEKRVRGDSKDPRENDRTRTMWEKRLQDAKKRLADLRKEDTRGPGVKEDIREAESDINEAEEILKELRSK